jgi:putative transposase
MATPLRSSQPGTFFVTTCTLNRMRLFQRQVDAQILLDTIQHYRSEGHYLLHDFVVMPDHLHLLITPKNETTLERAVQLIKGGSSRRIESTLPIWQKGFTDHRVRDRADFDARRKYIRENPVEAGLVQFTEDYPFSSAFRKAPSAAEAANLTEL